MHIGKAIAGNLLAGSLGRIINALTPLVLVPFMIRSWGLHQYGEWLILTAIPTYMMLSPDFGLSSAVVNQMAISITQGKRSEAISLYRTSWLFLTVMAACFVLIGITVAHWIIWKPLGVTMLSNHAAEIISWSLVQVFLGFQLYLLSGIYRGVRQNPRNGLLNSLGYGFYLLVGCTTLALKANPLGFLIAYAAARAAFLVFMLLDARRIGPEFTLGFKGVSLGAIRPYIVPGLGHATMPLVNALQNEGTVLVLGAILGPVSVAVFQTTRTAVNGAKSLTGLTASAVMQEIPALVGEGRMDTIRRLLVMNTQASLAAALGWLLLLAVFGKPIFHLWLRSDAVYSESLVLLMLASIFPFVIASSFGIVLLATNQIHRVVLFLVPTALVSLAVTALGGFFFGISGAATGLLAFETLSLVVICYFAAKRTGMQVRSTLAAVFSFGSLGSTYNSVLVVSRGAFRLMKSAVS
jgi:O-antigen/teichoic acid export membrane protein